MINITSNKPRLVDRITSYLDNVFASITSERGRQTAIPRLPVPLSIQRAQEKFTGDAKVEANAVGDLAQLAFNNFETLADKKAWEAEAKSAIGRHLAGKNVSFIDEEGNEFVAVRWVRPNPAADADTVFVDRSNNGRYLVGIEPVAATTNIPPIAETTTDSPLTNFAIPQPASSIAGATLATAHGPIATSSTACTHEPVAIDMLLSGVRPALGRQLCLPCVAARATAIADSAAAGLSQARWDALLAAHAPGVESNVTDEYTAVQALRDNARHIVSDAWLEAVQLAGIALGVGNPTSPIHINKVAVVALERVAGEMVGDAWPEAAVRVAVVTTALKDVARELLLSTYSKGEGSRSALPRTIVDVAVDKALDPAFVGLLGEEGARLAGQGMFLRAWNAAWNEYYMSITFESLVSPEEWAKVRAHGSVETE